MALMVPVKLQQAAARNNVRTYSSKQSDFERDLDEQEQNALGVKRNLLEQGLRARNGFEATLSPSIFSNAAREQKQPVQSCRVQLSG